MIYRIGPRFHNLANADDLASCERPQRISRVITPEARQPKRT